MISKRYGVMGLLVLLAVTLAGCGRAPTPQPMPTPVATQPLAAAGPRSSGDTVVASGEVVPVLKAEMGFTVSGRVQTVAVAEGDEVQPGEVLVTLETAGIEAQITQAEAALAVSQANLAQIQAGATAGGDRRGSGSPGRSPGRGLRRQSQPGFRPGSAGQAGSGTQTGGADGSQGGHGQSSRGLAVGPKRVRQDRLAERHRGHPAGGGPPASQH